MRVGVPWLCDIWLPAPAGRGPACPPCLALSSPASQTLADPEKRAAYDSIVGFEVGGVNPFMDTSYEPEFVFVDEFTCIGWVA